MIETIGILGGGQLGRMLTLEAKRMGYRVVTLEPLPNSPCGQVADEQIVAAYDDLRAIGELVRKYQQDGRVTIEYVTHVYYGRL